MPIRVDCGGASAVWRTHETPGDGEANGPFAGPGPRRGIDRHDTGSVEDTSRQGCEIAKTPGRKGPILSKCGERIDSGVVGRRRIHPCPFPSRRSFWVLAAARTAETVFFKVSKLNGLARTGQLSSSFGQSTC